MLFFVIPLLIALAAFIGIVVVVWGKMPFLRKLTPESHDVGQTWFHDMAPEVFTWYRSIRWKHFMHAALLELEKMIRRGRLVMAAFDRFTDKLVYRVRRVHEETAKQVQKADALQEAAREEEAKDPDELDMNDTEQLKAEEQRLIIAIAQDPKDASLYNDLARVYIKLQNYADAVESLTAAVKIDPENQMYAKRLENTKRRLSTQQK